MGRSLVTVAKQEYVQASGAERFWAGLIDVIIAFLLITFLGVLLGGLLAVVYLLVGDAIFGGRRLGKRLLGLKVIDSRSGAPCSSSQDFVRNGGRASYFLGGGIGALLRAYDHAAGNIPDKPELLVVLARPVTDADRPPPEKPAKLDLEGMKRSLQRSSGSGEGTIDRSAQ